MIKANQINLWAAFRFSIVLSSLTVITNLVMNFVVPNSELVMLVFLSNIPLCFYFATLALRDTRDKVEALETRIKQLESKKYHADMLASA